MFICNIGIRTCEVISGSAYESQQRIDDLFEEGAHNPWTIEKGGREWLFPYAHFYTISITKTY